MKNPIFILLALALFAWVGCGGEGTTENEGTTDEAEEQVIEEVSGTIENATENIKAQADSTKKALDELDEL